MACLPGRRVVRRRKVRLHDLRPAILSCYGGQCLGCAASAEVIDHFKPRHAGGTDLPVNLLPLFAICNRIKSCLWPGHGYHAIRGYDELERALDILAREIVFQEGIYGTSGLLEQLGGDVPVLRAIENCLPEARPVRYASLTDALRAELGSSSRLCLPSKANRTWGYSLLRDASRGLVHWHRT